MIADPCAWRVLERKEEGGYNLIHCDARECCDINKAQVFIDRCLLLWTMTGRRRRVALILTMEDEEEEKEGEVVVVVVGEAKVRVIKVVIRFRSD